MRKVAFHILKGGTGKTSLAGNTATAISEQKKVVLIDADPQGSLTSWLLKAAPRWELADVLQKKVAAGDALVSVNENLSMLGTFAIGGDLQKFADSGEMTAHPFLFEDLARELERLNFKLAIFDMSPGMRLLEKYVILAMDEIVTPLVPEFFAIDGIEAFTEHLKDINLSYRREVKHRTIVANLINRSFRRHILFFEELEKMRYRLFPVPQDSRIPESQIVHESLFTYWPGSRADAPIRKLAAEGVV